jgi:hypothetical protein
MHRTPTIPLVATAALVALAACSKDSTSPATLVSDPQVTADVAASAGDAIATDVAAMIGDELNVALPAPGLSFDMTGARADAISYTRTRTCYDAGDVEVPGCSPLSSVVTIVFHVTLDGSHDGLFFTTAVHRARDWTLTRLFTDVTETARQHDGIGTSNDTTVFHNAETQVTRTHALTAHDTADAVVFDLPRSTNPWPVSGTMVRRVAVHSTFSSPTQESTRDYTKRVEVDFPADAQGNVVLKIDDLTCTLNLVTHAVTGCQ